MVASGAASGLTWRAAVGGHASARQEEPMALSRREFLGAAALGPLAVKAFGAPAALPVRPFGRTGLRIPILAFGSGSRFVSYEKDEDALAVLTRALDQGITYIDTAHSYGDGKSEERIGQLMPARRSQVVLATKLEARKADDARRQLELSLKRLRTDHLDVLHIHGLESGDDLAAIEAKGGVLEAVMEARDQKVTRFVGITGHADPPAMKEALERHDFDCVQMALNLARARMSWPDGKTVATPMGDSSFEALALPVANRKQMGVIAMKVFAQDQLAGKASPEKILYYSLSLPVSLASVGMPKPEMLEENLALVRRFAPLGAPEMEKLRAAVGETERHALARFFRHHHDA
jgi:aryl-alcohol dehydrogenase-like predicted oxidoreductase